MMGLMADAKAIRKRSGLRGKKERGVSAEGRGSSAKGEVWRRDRLTINQAFSVHSLLYA